MTSRRPEKSAKSKKKTADRTKGASRAAQTAKPAPAKKPKPKPPKRTKADIKAEAARRETLRHEAAARREARRQAWHEARRKPPPQPPIGAPNAMLVRDEPLADVPPPGAPAMPTGWDSPVPPEINNIDELRPDGLTYRQDLFVTAYLGPAMLDAGRAAGMAGFAGTRKQMLAAGYRMLANELVQSRVRARVGSMAQAVTKEDLMALIQRRCRSSFVDLMDVATDANGNPCVFVSLSRALETGAADNIRKVREKLGPDGVLERTIEIYEPRPYIELLARHYGMDQLPDKAERDRAATLSDRAVLIELLATGERQPDALAPRPIVVNRDLAPLSSLNPQDVAVVSPDLGDDDDGDADAGYDRPPKEQPDGPDPADPAEDEQIDALSGPDGT